MPGSFEVTSASGGYAVRVEAGSLAALLADGGERIAIADSHFAPQLAGAGLEVVAIDATEASKSLDRLPAVIGRIRELGATRNTTLLAVGGGTVQDVACFAASVYMRGIKWVYVPTTLLGMVDSCIGGKSSINVGLHKNIVGTFHPPLLVQVDPTLCETLSEEQRVAGLCEAAKICFARDPAVFADYLHLRPGVESGTEQLTKLVELSLRAKKWFVEIDEFDAGERLLLNFGHTFGHALESASRYRLSHGIAVGLGMLSAIALARDRSGPPPSQEAQALLTALRTHIGGLLTQVPRLREVLSTIALSDLWDAFCSDKKHARTAFNVVVPNAQSRLSIQSMPRDARSQTAIQSAFADALTFRGS